MSEFNNENIYSKRLRAGKRRTYFFDVRTTKNNDYFVTLTESKKRYDGDGYDRHKIFLYKEDFNKFIDALTDTINHIKTNLMPDFDFDSFNHDQYEEHQTSAPVPIEEPSSATDITAKSEVVPQAETMDMETPTPENVSHEQNLKNPSANDEAQTW